MLVSVAPQAKQAALLFVRDLPAGRGVRFNVVLFGSSVELMAPASVAYDKEAEAKAVAYIQVWAAPGNLVYDGNGCCCTFSCLHI